MRRAIATGMLTLATTFAVLATAGPTLAAPAARAKWTVMVYMSGDNNLEDYVVKDIELELARRGSTANVQITALADRGPGYDTSRGDWQTTKLFHPTQGMTADAANAVADWGERNMGNPQTLVDFVTWSKTNYPADRYALYFWGHGWNWHPGYVMEDESHGAGGDALDADELKSVLPQLGFIDVVGYDACNMAAIEIADLWHGSATAVAASQELVNMDGIEYETIIDALNANPNMTADQLAAETSKSATNEYTFSSFAVDSRYLNLKNAVNNWAAAMRARMAADKSKIIRGIGNAKSFWQAPTDKDLSDLAAKINAQVTDANIRATGNAVIGAVDALVLHRRSSGKSYSMVRGITITVIHKAVDQRHAWFSYYRSLGFNTTTQWDEFLVDVAS